MVPLICIPLLRQLQSKGISWIYLILFLLASRFMPPMVPVLGRPCIAVEFAQLIVGKEKRGIRPFLVNINDGRHMCSGITTKYVIYRVYSQLYILTVRQATPSQKWLISCEPWHHFLPARQASPGRSACGGRREVPVRAF